MEIGETETTAWKVPRALRAGGELMPNKFSDGEFSRGHQDSEVGNRKLIRASHADMQDPMNSCPEKRKRQPPPEQTDAENFYYLKQMQVRTPMVVVLTSGEALHGVIEWYDKHCIKIHRAGQPNLLVMKTSIRYLYKG
jgi:host factor-I protein